MKEQFSRTALMLGDSAVDRLERASVAIFGVGGVGSFAAEAIARAGVGRITLIDGDTVAQSNLNRQLIALHSTIGREKALVMADRIRDINPDAAVTALPIFYEESTAGQFDPSAHDYVIDAIDTVKSKLLLIERCKAAGTPIISCMGAGNKLDPTRFAVADIAQTSVCPLARTMRKELKKRGIGHLDVVFSTELPSLPPEHGRLPGSVSFVPGAAGLALAGHVIRRLIGLDVEAISR